MSNTTRLLVLGVVRIFQPVHGYDVRRELMSWHVHEWASIAPGSIYNALKSLTKDGLLEVVGTKQVGGRPERTTYRLTARGDQEFTEMLRDTWWTVRMPLDPLAAAVALISFMQRDEAIAALEARIAHVQGQLKHAEYAIAAIDDIETPGHVRELMRLIYARVGSEIAWANALIPRLRAGEYRLAEDPPWKPVLAAKPARGRATASDGGGKLAARQARATTSAAGSKPAARQARQPTTAGTSGKPRRRTASDASEKPAARQPPRRTATSDGSAAVTRRLRKIR